MADRCRSLVLRHARRIYRAVLVVGLALLSGGALAGEYLIDISGTPAIKFRADCRFVADDGSIRRVKFRGMVPARYKASTTALSCLVQKWDAMGRLRVRLLDGNRVVARRETAAPFNWLRVSTPGRLESRVK